MLAAAFLSLVVSAGSAFGQDRSELAPTRLDFDAARAPAKCNDDSEFLSILGTWVKSDLLRPDAERRLVVRIRWSRAGGKVADLSLIDAQGVTVVERRKSFAAGTECHLVLSRLAYEAAEILGAFEPPPPKEPVTSSVPPPCPSCPPERPCPACVLPAPLKVIPQPKRSFIGLGAFVGPGIFSKLAGGPYLLTGFAPSPRLPWQVEFEGGWTSQSWDSTSTTLSIRAHAFPLVGSLCSVRGMVRFCGGLATVIVYSNQSSANEALDLLLSANFRVGTELLVDGPLSIRADVFGRFALAHRRFGDSAMVVDGASALAAGVAVTAGWSLD